MANKATFQGQYVDDIVLALIASALSGNHSLLIGGPGLGKTTIARYVANFIFQNWHVFVRFDSSTSMRKVEGMPDIETFLTQNIFRLITDGTPYQKDALCIIADEIGRPGDPVFDKMLDVLDRQDIDRDKAPVMFGTANFMPVSERVEAFHDRIGLWVWLPNEALNWKSVARAQLYGIRPGGLSLTHKLPTLQDVKDVRAMEPGEDAINACADLIDTLATEASKGVTSNGDVVARFDVNPRRINQWVHVLFRVGAYFSGMNDNFTEVPAEARACLKWCWPLTDRKMAGYWETICETVSDPVEAVIKSMLKVAYDAMVAVGEDPNLKDDPRLKSIKLGEVFQEQQRNLAVLEDDPRVTAAFDDLQEAWHKVSKGENPYE